MDPGLQAVAQAAHAYPQDRFDGQGIVICAGGARLLANAWVAIAVLRRTLGCDLPIEVWHLGPEELGTVEASLFADLDAATVDALEVAARHPARILGGWELKSYAVAHCRFREVLLLDADNVPTRDPAFLFGTAPYSDTGALFWPDIVRLGRDNGMWDLCGVAYRSEPAWESGQLVVDKQRCWPALAAVRYMNDHSDLFYEHSHGDKDTFHLAWLMADQPYAMTPHRARSVPYGILQHDFAGAALFQHRTTAKWVLHGENVRSDAFRYEAECLTYLAELRSRWSGRIESLPDRSGGDLATEAALAATRWFRLDRVGSDAGLIELLAGNRVGEGRTGDALRWWVEGGELVVAGRGGPSFRFRPVDAERWVGRSEPNGGVVELHAQPDTGTPSPEAAVVAAVLGDVERDPGIDLDDAVATLATLGRVCDLGDVLVRERSRWPAGTRAASVIEGASKRLGRRDPACAPMASPPATAMTQPDILFLTP